MIENLVHEQLYLRPSYLEDHCTLLLRRRPQLPLRSVISINVILHTEGSVATTPISKPQKRFLLIVIKVTSYNP
jgi:hypothetical protein